MESQRIALFSNLAGSIVHDAIVAVEPQHSGSTVRYRGTIYPNQPAGWLPGGATKNPPFGGFFAMICFPFQSTMCSSPQAGPDQSREIVFFYKENQIFGPGIVITPGS